MKNCIFEIPRKVVFLKYHEKLYFLKYFYTGLSVPSRVCMIRFYFQKIQLEMPVIHCTYLEQYLNAQRALAVHGKKHNEKLYFFTSIMFAVHRVVSSNTCY